MIEKIAIKSVRLPHRDESYYTEKVMDIIFENQVELAEKINELVEQTNKTFKITILE